MYAFLGGQTRYLSDPGILGVHQFRGAQDDSGEIAAQVTTAMLAEYLDEMGVDRKLLDAASPTLPSEIHPISMQLAKLLNVDNTDPPKSEWRLTADNSGQISVVTVLRQARHNAITEFNITRKGAGLIGRVTYSTMQHFRSATDLQKIFASDPLKFTFGVDGKELVSAASSWVRVRNQVYATEFYIPDQVILELPKASRLTLDWSFPSAYRDVDPTTEFGTADLANAIKAILRKN